MNVWKGWIDGLRRALGSRATRTSGVPDFHYKQILRDIFREAIQVSQVFEIEDRDGGDFIIRGEQIVICPSFDQRDQYLDVKLFGTEHYQAMEAEKNAFESLRLYDEAYDLRSLSEPIKRAMERFDIRDTARSVIAVRESLSLLVTEFPEVLNGDVPRCGEDSKVRIWEGETGWREADE